MAKFKVRYKVTDHFTIEIEANSPEEAQAIVQSSQFEGETRELDYFTLEVKDVVEL